MDAEHTVPDPTYLQLRERILHLDPAEVGLHPSDPAANIWGVLMESGYPEGTATLVSLADGTTSVYFSTGGGLLGSPEYTPIAEASKAFVAQAESHRNDMAPAAVFPLPEAGQVRFICLTYMGFFTTEAAEKSLASGHHPLSPLYQAGRETLSRLRSSAEKKRK
jgi:hypothetical protein